ncbi:jg491 [Pararge aegeria aegeria]|uniref:Jg491 protein n=1 Tax=Pararge aegeria aegeria TaxID=348720 RepID=A0A8S4QQZ9_9NEOP|nr:jg491 [Pararge aegeria aegeria]
MVVWSAITSRLARRSARAARASASNSINQQEPAEELGAATAGTGGHSIVVSWLLYAYARAAAGHVEARRCRSVHLTSSHSSTQPPIHN